MGQPGGGGTPAQSAGGSSEVPSLCGQRSWALRSRLSSVLGGCLRAPGAGPRSKFAKCSAFGSGVFSFSASASTSSRWAVCRFRLPPGLSPPGACHAGLALPPGLGSWAVGLPHAARVSRELLRAPRVRHLSPLTWQLLQMAVVLSVPKSTLFWHHLWLPAWMPPDQQRGTENSSARKNRDENRGRWKVTAQGRLVTTS